MSASADAARKGLGRRLMLQHASDGRAAHEAGFRGVRHLLPNAEGPRYCSNRRVAPAPDLASAAGEEGQ
jgi:hypothetical protein